MYSQVPNKRGVLIIRGLEKVSIFNKRGGPKYTGVRLLEMALNGYKATERTKTGCTKR